MDLKMWLFPRFVSVANMVQNNGNAQSATKQDLTHGSMHRLRGL